LANHEQENLSCAWVIQMSCNIDLLGIEVDSAAMDNNLSVLTTLLEKCDHD